MLKFGNKNKNNQRRVSIQDPSEGTPLIISGGTEEEEVGVARETAAVAAAAATGNEYDDDDSNNSEDPNYHPLGEVMFEGLKDNERRESIAADKLSMRLLEIDDDDSETEEMILRESLLSMNQDLLTLSPSRRPSSSSSPRLSTRMSLRTTGGRPPMSVEEMEEATRKAALERLCTIIGISVLALLAIGVALYIGVEFIGPPNMPVGPYELVERQVMPFVFYCLVVWVVGDIIVPTDTLFTQTSFCCMLFLLRLISSLLFCRREPNFSDFTPFTKDRIQLDRMDISIMCHRHRLWPWELPM
jgi:hypothetical protein